MTNNTLCDFDKEIYQSIDLEQKRQHDHLELIASENYVSKAVLEAQGSILTNKYAEGYSGNRYYGGCEHVDVAENIAISRAKELFKADFANVQPHCGSSANMIAIASLINPGDKILGMGLSAGGHLTHGSKVNFSGKYYKSFQYGVDSETGHIDYDKVLKIAKNRSPDLIIAGFSAYSQIVDWNRFREIADSVGAALLVDMAHIAGLVATDLYPSPVGIADITTTTTHKTLRGPRGGLILTKSNPELEKKINFLTFPGLQGGPLMHVIAAKAVAFKEALNPQFYVYQSQVLINSCAMADTLSSRGYDIVGGGTENHIILIDLSKQGLTGQQAERALADSNITVNKNSIPNDPLPSSVTSGIRIGSPAITTRGFNKEDCISIANWISEVLDNINDTKTINRIKRQVLQICNKRPL